jgi:predicted kinase
MSTLICTVGLPRAGKSTWMKPLRKAHGWPVVEPDAIRRAIHGTPFNSKAEPLVWSTARIMVRSLFEAGHDVVLFDSTMVTAKRRSMFAYEDFTVCWKEFYTDVATCIERAKETGQEYLVPVIQRMSDNRDPLCDEDLLFEDWYRDTFVATAPADLAADGGELILHSTLGLPSEDEEARQ